jgi:hypothetical protein
MKERILAFKAAKALEKKDINDVAGSGAASRTTIMTYNSGDIDVCIDE